MMDKHTNQTQIDAILAKHKDRASIVAKLRMADDNLEQLELFSDVFGAGATIDEATRRQLAIVDTLEEKLVEME